MQRLEEVSDGWSDGQAEKRVGRFLGISWSDPDHPLYLHQSRTTFSGRTMTEDAVDTSLAILCSDCFTDEGLRIDAVKLGREQNGACPNCHSPDVRKLTKELIQALAWRFFVGGTTVRCNYGAAPVIQCNEDHFGRSDILPSTWLKDDIKLLDEAAQLGFFHYGPRLWMVGEIEPLNDLKNESTRLQIINRVLKEYPKKTLGGAKFHGLLGCPQRPADPLVYDSPPITFAGGGRLDSPGFPIMYGSQDIDACTHECRASTEDDIYVATLEPQKDLRLLDLTHLLEEDVPVR